VAGLMITAAALSSCARLQQSDEQAQVAKAFADWKADLVAGHPGEAMVYFPRDVDDYLATLNSGANRTKPASVAAPVSPPSETPGVDLLLRTALEKKVPAELRAKLTFATLVQRIAQRDLFNPRDVKQLDLGRISVQGDHATAQVYYQGTLTALQLPFMREDHAWKIDVLALRPYGEVLMRVDRAIKGETEAEQVDQLVSKLPSL
jgi:hypothetical protein